MTDVAAAIQESVKGLYPALLGIKFLKAEAEGVKAELTVREELCTVPGIMHGGAMMGFADTLGAVATALNLPRGAGTTTIESKTNFFAPARTGATIVGDCTPLHRGKTTMVWQTRVTVDEKLVALITQTQMVLQPRT